MTVNELRAALDKLVAEKPALGELPAELADIDHGLCEITAVKPFTPSDMVPYGGGSRADRNSVVFAAKQNLTDDDR